MVNSNGTNVWGRELADGSWAFVFLNIGPNPVDISCDISCFEAAGFDLSVKLTVRDLWTHTVRRRFLIRQSFICTCFRLMERLRGVDTQRKAFLEMVDLSWSSSPGLQRKVRRTMFLFLCALFLSIFSANASIFGLLRTGSPSFLEAHGLCRSDKSRPWRR